MSEWQKCPKCGSSDIHITWHDKGEWVEPCNARYYHTEELTAEILRHYCRGCGYEWNTPPTGKMSDELFGTLKDALESARKEIAALRLKIRIKSKVIAARNEQIARLTKLTRILAWQMGYSRWLFPHEINTLADNNLAIANDVISRIDQPLYKHMKPYVEQEARDD